MNLFRNTNQNETETTKEPLFRKILAGIAMIILVFGTYILGVIAAEGDIDSRKAEYHETVKQIESKQSELTEAEKDISTKQTELKDIEKKITSTNTKLDETKEELKSKEAEYNETIKVIESKKQIESEISSLNNTIGNKQSEIKTLDQTIEEKQKTVLEEEEKIKAADETLNYMKGIIQEAEKARKTLPAGYFLVGKDIPADRYKITTNGTRGSNLFVYNKEGKTVVNTIISSRSGHGVSEYVVALSDGMMIEANDTFLYIPVK